MIDARGIAGRFATDGKSVRVEPHGRGHINDTFVVTTDRGRRYVLQRINEKVFPDPWIVAVNTARVVEHIEAKAPRLVPALIRALDGEPGLRSADGVWRMLAYVEDSEPGAPPLTLPAARVAGEAFGRFQAALADYDGAAHIAPIPGFLELSPWLIRLDSALSACDRVRRDRAQGVIRGLMAHRDAVASLNHGPAGAIHGDCKVGNLLFERGSVACGRPRLRAVIDLDTVMIAPRVWDFGDLVRSAAAGGEEDAPGLAMDLERFAELARGFAAGLGPLFDDDLRAALPTAPRYITLTLAMRFLVDYLEGDRYFRVDDDAHNLRRARAQLTLLESQAALAGEMERTVESLR